jgi:hypothetical protein
MIAPAEATADIFWKSNRRNLRFVIGHTLKAPPKMSEPMLCSVIGRDRSRSTTAPLRIHIHNDWLTTKRWCTYSDIAEPTGPYAGNCWVVRRRLPVGVDVTVR